MGGSVAEVGEAAGGSGHHEHGGNRLEYQQTNENVAGSTFQMD